jgi:heme-degrading monooxygenase HmoA
MIVERAQIDVRPGSGPAFEEAFPQGRAVLAQGHGFRSAQLSRCLEVPDRYLLLIEWERLEDHTEGFRGSELFTRWREVIGPFLAAPPVVEHYEPVVGP